MDSSPDKKPVWLGAAWGMRAIWVFGIGLFLSQLIEIPWRSALRGYDNTFNYLWLRSAMVDGDFDFRNDLQQCNTLTSDYRSAALSLPPTETGRIPNKYGVGWAVVTLPFYLIADAIVGAGRLAGVWSLERDGFNPVYQVVIQIGQGVLAVFALCLATRLVRGWIGGDAREVVTIVWAASPLLYYQTSNLSMSHGVAFFSITLGAYGLQLARESPCTFKWWLWAGFGFGLAAVIRFQLAVFAILPAWALGELWIKKTGRLRVALTGLILGGLPFLLLQLWAWRSVYGRWLIFSYGVEGEGFNWSEPAVGKSLFSSWHGLYYWHPLLLLGTAGLVGWAWTRRQFAVAIALSFFATLYVNAAWWCWWFGSAFGNRAYDAAILPLMAGFGWLVGRFSGRRRRILMIIAIGAIIWNFYILLLYRTAAISRSEPVRWIEMLSAGF